MTKPHDEQGGAGQVSADTLFDDVPPPTLPPPPMPEAHAGMEPQVSTLPGAHQVVQPMHVSTSSVDGVAPPMLVLAPSALSEVVWPRDVPSREEAIAILSGASAPEERLVNTVQRFVGELTDLQRKVLVRSDFLWDPAPVVDALALQFRLLAAGELRPPPARPTGEPIPFDLAGLDELLRGVDGVLQGVSAAPAGAEADVVEAFEKARGGLAHQAVVTTELKDRLLRLPRERGASGVRERGGSGVRQPQARGESVKAAPPRRSSSIAQPPVQASSRVRTIVLLLLVIASGVGAGYYHSTRGKMLRQSKSIPGLPAGMAGAVSKSGALMARAKPGQSLDPKARQELEKTAKSSGKVVHEVVPGMFLLVPPNVQIPMIPTEMLPPQVVPPFAGAPKKGPPQ